MLKSLKNIKSKIIKHNRKWSVTNYENTYNAKETFQERVKHVNEDIDEYLERYYRENMIRIYPNHEHDQQLEITCPTCRKHLKIPKRRRSVYVRTECVCCLKEVTKTVVLSCRHANICRDCYEKIIEQNKDDPPYFLYGNGEPVDITNEQIHLYVRKKSCYLDW